jgi:hypothetical protein
MESRVRWAGVSTLELDELARVSWEKVGRGPRCPRTYPTYKAGGGLSWVTPVSA